MRFNKYGEIEKDWKAKEQKILKNRTLGHLYHESTNDQGQAQDKGN
jgi:hypothetical protein